MSLTWGERLTGGESGGAWWATLDGERVVVKRAGLDALERFEALADLLDRLRARGVPTPSYRLLPHENELVVAQSVLPGATRDELGPALVEDVLRVSELLADVPDVPTVRGVDWPALLQHSLVVGEEGWCVHEPLRVHSARTRALVERVEEIGAALDVSAVPTADCVHVDLHHHNVLVDDRGRLTGIIDWDGALPGDRWFDVVYFAMSAEAWVSDRAVLEPLYLAAEAAVAPALLGAYVAHVGLRQTEWQLTHHGASAAEVRLENAERLMARYPVS